MNEKQSSERRLIDDDEDDGNILSNPEEILNTPIGEGNVLGAQRYLKAIKQVGYIKPDLVTPRYSVKVYNSPEYKKELEKQRKAEFEEQRRSQNRRMSEESPSHRQKEHVSRNRMKEEIVYNRRREQNPSRYSNQEYY